MRRFAASTLDEVSEVWVFLNGLLALVVAGAVYKLLHHFWGHDMLLAWDQLFKSGSILSGLGRVWFIFAWAAAGPLFAVFILHERASSYDTRGLLLLKGWWISLNAGVFEELIFRGFIFLSGMVVVRFMNTITFGFEKWFALHVEMPLADWFTFHALHAQLAGNPNWVFGGALVLAAGLFRNEHGYLGLFGYINSWFIGMVMFYLVFHYGIVAAIVAHVLYDAIIFTIIALTSMPESPLSRALRGALDRW
jgi:hypothetical protein